MNSGPKGGYRAYMGWAVQGQCALGLGKVQGPHVLSPKVRLRAHAKPASLPLGSNIYASLPLGSNIYI